MVLFFFNDTATTEIYTLSLHDALPISTQAFEVGDPFLATEKNIGVEAFVRAQTPGWRLSATVFGNWFDDYIFRSEEHTSELQSRHISYAVFCLKKKKIIMISEEYMCEL